MRGQGALPLWDDPVRSHCRQSIGSFATREILTKEVHSIQKRICCTALFFPAQVHSWLHGLWEKNAVCTLQDNRIYHLLLQNNPKYNLKRAEDLAAFQKQSHWPGGALISTACTNNKIWVLLSSNVGKKWLWVYNCRLTVMSLASIPCSFPLSEVLHMLPLSTPTIRLTMPTLCYCNWPDELSQVPHSSLPHRYLIWGRRIMQCIWAGINGLCFI